MRWAFTDTPPIGFVEVSGSPPVVPAPPLARWTGKLINYKGWTWGWGNQHGFVYQAQTVHRCIAAGLTEMPQFTQAESIRVCEIIDEINRQCAATGFEVT